MNTYQALQVIFGPIGVKAAAAPLAILERFLLRMERMPDSRFPLRRGRTQVEGTNLAGVCDLQF
jgi:hypothetical protein